MKHHCYFPWCERPVVSHVNSSNSDHIYRYCAEHFDQFDPDRLGRPKLIIAPDIPAEEVMQLRAHIDEAVSDPDYSVLVSYEQDWQ
jgi:hypothetical protein